MQQTEILIIGGGIAGTSTAFYLTRYGHEVTLLERSEIATEASGLNAGTLWTTGWGTTPTLSSTLSMGGLDIRNLQPIIGKIPWVENLYVLTGLGSSGFEQGPMAGKLLADCIHNGIASPILSEADPTHQVTLQ